MNSETWVWKDVPNQKFQNCLKSDENNCETGGRPLKIYGFDTAINSNAYWQDMPLNQDGLNTEQCSWENLPSKFSFETHWNGTMHIKNGLVQNFMTLVIVGQDANYNEKILSCGTVLESDLNPEMTQISNEKPYSMIRNYDSEVRTSLTFRMDTAENNYDMEHVYSDNNTHSSHSSFTKNFAINMESDMIDYPLDKDSVKVQVFAGNNCEGSVISTDPLTSNMMNSNSWGLLKVHWSDSDKNIKLMSISIELESIGYETCMVLFENQHFKIAPQYGIINGTYDESDNMPDVQVVNSKFTQNSPFHPTSFSISYTQYLSPRSDSALDNYHIHEFPLGPTTQSVAPAFTAAHHNPYGALTPFGPSVRDFEVGDLSSKHGGINGSPNFELLPNSQFLDFELPLFGIYNIGGRSLVFHQIETGDRIIGGNLSYVDSQNDYFQGGYTQVDKIVADENDQLWLTIRQNNPDDKFLDHKVFDNMYITMRTQGQAGDFLTELSENCCVCQNYGFSALLDKSSINFGPDMKSYQTTTLTVELEELKMNGGCFRVFNENGVKFEIDIGEASEEVTTQEVTTQESVTDSASFVRISGVFVFLTVLLL